MQLQLNNYQTIEFKSIMKSARQINLLAAIYRYIYLLIGQNGLVLNMCQASVTLDIRSDIRLKH